MEQQTTSDESFNLFISAGQEAREERLKSLTNSHDALTSEFDLHAEFDDLIGRQFEECGGARGVA